MTPEPGPLPDVPGTGLCRCGAPYFYQHAPGLGLGHLLCHRCGRRYRIPGTGGWTPGVQRQAEPVEERRPVVPTAGDCPA